MNNGQIFDLINIMIRKEKEGDTISPDDFSELLQMCSWEKGNIDFEYYEKSQVITDSLRNLKESDTIALTTGVGDYISGTTNYWHVIGVETATQKVERLTDDQFLDRKYNALLQPSTDFPVCNLFGDSIKVLPTSITSVTFNYFKEPTTPFYDYYIDVNDNYIYMEPGSSHLLVAGEEYRDGTTTGTVNSISVEMSYPDNERIQVIYMMLEKIGVALNEQDAVQYGLMKEQKEETT